MKPELNKIKLAALMSSVIFTASGVALAETNVNDKVEQLKENVQASTANLQQYEQNLKVIEQNLNEVKAAQKSLEAQKQAILKRRELAQKGKAGIDASQRQVQTNLQNEKAKLTIEEKQIADVKATLATLEANKKKREENIAAYQDKINKMDQENANWAAHSQDIVDLEHAIQDKQNQTFADQKLLAEKKAAYEEEIAKWNKQVRVSQRNYAHYQSLKDE